MSNFEFYIPNCSKPLFLDFEDMDLVRNNNYKINSKGYLMIKGIEIHKLLINKPSGFMTDHINRNKLDNRKSNLRICTRSQNQQNIDKRPRRNKKSSMFKGVYWNKPTRKWLSQIRFQWKRIHLGLFESEVEAALAYNEAAVKYHGEFAVLNNVEKIGGNKCH